LIIYAATCTGVAAALPVAVAHPPAVPLAFTVAFAIAVAPAVAVACAVATRPGDHLFIGGSPCMVTARPVP
jgi:hypothetical protein